MISWQILAFLLVKFLLANFPWVSTSVFFIKPLPKKNALRWRLVQWVISLMLAFLLALLVERFLMGSIYSQDWEFYITFICLFLVFSFPGFIYQLAIR